MTAAVEAPPVAADLALVRMALPAKKPPAPAVVRRDVGNLLHGRPLSPDEFAAVRDGLAATGLVEIVGRAIRLNAAGRGHALAFLGVVELPPRTRWATVQSKYLFPKAAGLSVAAAGRLKTPDQLAGFVLARKYDLPPSAAGSARRAAEALACRELGHPEETSFDGLLSAVLGRLLGAEGRLTAAQIVAQLPVFGTGLKSTTGKAVRDELVRSWLAAARPEATPPAEFDLPTFAETVKALARVSPPADRFHDNKAFIAAVWRAGQREPGFPRLTLPEFKAHLVEANRAGLLRLSRADLVQAMDPVQVAESETEYLNATFHFVLIEGDRP